MYPGLSSMGRALSSHQTVFNSGRSISPSPICFTWSGVAFTKRLPSSITFLLCMIGGFKWSIFNVVNAFFTEIMTVRLAILKVPPFAFEGLVKLAFCFRVALVWHSGSMRYWRALHIKPPEKQGYSLKNFLHGS